MNILIDPASGSPRWNAAEKRIGPKEDFALEAALQIRDGRLTLDQLKTQIIEAGNIELGRRREVGTIHTLNDLKERLGKSGKDWFFEIQRVSQDSTLLEALIEEEGRGLTKLARLAGPVQLQRGKGFSEHRASEAIKTLTKLLEQAHVRAGRDVKFADDLLAECEGALANLKALFAR